MASLVHQTRASYAFFERNWNLTKRYWAWEVVWLVYNVINALSVTLISKNTQMLGNVSHAQVNALTLYLIIGTAVWSYLSVTFDGITDMINIERWEGTIEHTFMAPISRFTHMFGSCWYAVIHGIFYTFVQLLIVASFFNLDLSRANYLTAVFVLVLGSISFIGLGIGASTLPLLFTERGAQMSYIIKAVVLLVSGVYYPVEVLPIWMQAIARISPATYVLNGLRDALQNNAPIWSLTVWASTWPLLISAVVSVPLGLWVFGIAERYAKRTGRLKRNG